MSTDFLHSLVAVRVSSAGERSDNEAVTDRVESQVRLEALYRRFGPVVYSRCRRVLRDATLAEDAAQEVFMRVQKHLDDMPDDRAALAWIYRVSTNYCLNLLRDRARQAEPVGELPDLPGDHPEAAYANRNVALRLVERVPEKLQAPALLYYVDGLEQADVARILGISRRTVINRLAAFVERSRKIAARTRGPR
jgi:RNA polymerase sigma-70 factor, ECF subfamily